MKETKDRLIFKKIETGEYIAPEGGREVYHALTAVIMVNAHNTPEQTKLWYFDSLGDVWQQEA